MKWEGGIGIAANQLGFTSSIIIVEDTVMINPSLFIGLTDIQSDIEACLSLPGKFFKVRRSTRITASWIDKDGATCKEIMYGRRARIFQHELDHLNGITLANNLAATEITPNLY